MALIATSFLNVSTGAAPTFEAAAAADTAKVGPNNFLVVKNGSGAGITVTITVPGNLTTGDAKPDKAYAVGAGAEAWIPLIEEFRGDNGEAAIAYSATTTVTVAVVQR